MSVINRALILKLRQTKQDNLVSGTNLKTINGTSLLGSGDVSTGTTGVQFSAGATPPNSPTLGAIWLNTDTARTYQYVQDSVGTNAWLEMGGAEFADAAYTRTESSITVTNASTLTYNVSYYVDNVMVFHNGSKLTSSQFTATDGTSITLNITLAVNDVIDVTSINVL